MISSDLRKAIIESYNNGHSKKNISEILNVKLSTVYSIIDVYVLEGRLETKKRGSRPKALNDEHVLAIRRWIDDDASITLSALKNKLLEVYGISVCTKTIDNYIDSFGYSFKRTTLIPERRNNMNTIEVRATYALNWLDLREIYEAGNFIFIDEVGFNISMRSRRGRSLRGTRAVQTVSALRSKNISVCCAMSKNGVILYHSQATAFNTLCYKNFTESLITKIANMGSCVFIMDNVPFHKSPAIRETIESNGHKFLLLPPYSPFLNPIENLFSKWKNNIRQARPQGEVELFNLINNVSILITPEDCNGYYQHMRRFITKCINKEEIVDE